MLDERSGLRERTVFADRQGRDAAARVIGEEEGFPGRVDLEVTGRRSFRRLAVEESEFARGFFDGVGCDLLVILSTKRLRVNRVEETLIGRDGDEERILDAAGAFQRSERSILEREVERGDGSLVGAGEGGDESEGIVCGGGEGGGEKGKGHGQKEWRSKKRQGHGTAVSKWRCRDQRNPIRDRVGWWIGNAPALARSSIGFVQGGGLTFGDQPRIR